jgi:hypothetical protein
VVIKRVVQATFAIAIAFLSVFSAQLVAAKGNSSESKSPLGTNEISWQKDRKLSWDDFRGPVPVDAEEQTAAATFCGIGFETNTITAKNPNVKIRVYNTFYTGNSWVRPEEKNDAVLTHEQGHFDLCELYTRKLRAEMSNIKVDVNTLRPVLKSIYDQVQAEYRRRQEAYETETAHGVNYDEQSKWQKILERELKETEQWGEG